MIVVAHVGGLPVEETIAQLAPLGIVVLAVAGERMRRFGARLRGAGPNLRKARAALGIALVIVAVTVANSVAAGGLNRRPDLTVTSLTAAPTELAPGSSFSEGFKEKNRGRARARRTATGFYLSPGRRLGHGATGLLGRGRLRALQPRKRGKGRAQLVVPAEIVPGSYFLIACADAGRKVRERNERNNCRAAPGRVVVAAASGGGPGNGGAGPGNGPAECLPVADKPDLAFADTNCDGIDGDASHAIFVAPNGNDANAGTESAPKQSLHAAVNEAALQEKDVYAAEGTYLERLDVRNRVSVYGGYDANWQRSLSNATQITGAPGAAVDTEGAVALGVSDPTTLQLLTLMPEAPTVAGASSYALRGVSSSGLVLDHVTAIAAPGAAGNAGTNGLPGTAGGPGQTGQIGGTAHPAGGSSPVGHPGGEGGIFGKDDESGGDGGPGQDTAPDAFGKRGGLGGNGGGQEEDGEPGADGDDGVAGANGAGGGNADAGPGFAWRSEDGHDGLRGSGGHGGGGGGGGGGEDCSLPTCLDGDWGGNGGGGGGGGQGGGPGHGGKGGGGSFGIFLVSSPGAVVRDSSVIAGDGGRGGDGGDGATGGKGGAPGPGFKYEPNGGRGGDGGSGGKGGPGGSGGGGAGGPSVAIFGLDPPDTPGTTVSHGTGGGGGKGAFMGHGQYEFGATGVAADYL